MDWIGWLVVLAVCAVALGLVRDARRRRAARDVDATGAARRAATDAEHRRLGRDGVEVDQRHAGYGGGVG